MDRARERLELSRRRRFRSKACRLRRSAAPFSIRNASTALAAVESLGFGSRLTQDVVSKALRSVKLAGRFHTVPGPVEWILDVAHNEPAARVFADHLAARPSSGRTIAVVGILGDKDSAAIAQLLHPLVDRWIICTIHEPRGLPAEELARRMKARAARERIELATSMEEGFAAAKALAVPGDRVIVCGGFNIVGSALRWLPACTLSGDATALISIVLTLHLTSGCSREGETHRRNHPGCVAGAAGARAADGAESEVCCEAGWRRERAGFAPTPSIWRTTRTRIAAPTRRLRAPRPR